VDGFSHQPDYDTGERDNEEVVILPEHLFTNATEILTLDQQVEDAQRIHEPQMDKWKQEFAMEVIDERYFYRGQLVVPADEELRRKVLRQFHDHQLARHPGIANTIVAVTREFWWPDIRKFATTYIRGCATCQSTKAGTTRPKPPLLPIVSPEQQNPFQTISIDLITDLPMSEGYDSILTIVDQGCSKSAIFLPCRKTIDAQEAAILYAQRVFPYFGIPRRIISDRDPRFTAKFITELLLCSDPKYLSERFL
jgi:hypothetical protein